VAIDRAIRDEENLPEGYASGDPDPQVATESSNVVDVDFDSA
jgi:hypothetical protein